jgi:beta-lactam-binding protein with PASTA domain
VDPATEVSVELASGCSVRLPDVMGLRLSEALCLIRSVGLQSEPAIEGRPVSDSRVTALEPDAGTLVTPSTSVTISLARRPKRT